MDDDDRLRYLDLLAYVVRRWRWECSSYCLMPNHVHLLIRTPDANLGAGMQWFHSLYAQGFNERHGRIGHLFQDRYGSSRIWSPGRFRYIEDYIARNPVAAQLCAKPSDWPWSSTGTSAHDDLPRWMTTGDPESIDYGELAVAEA